MIAQMDYTTVTKDELWQAVSMRDRQADGTFVFAVRTTGVFCRPSCPARRPKRENVIFYDLPEQAQDAGFRPCLRCQPLEHRRDTHSLEIVEQTRRAIDARVSEETPVRLRDVGREIGVSPFHLQRLFKRVTGITPRQYADTQRTARLKSGLAQGESVTEAMYGAGYGSSSRLYETTHMSLGMTPTAYKQGGPRAVIRYSIAECSLGYLLVGATEKGVCAVTLGDSAETLEASLRTEYHAAELQRDDEGLNRSVEMLLSHLEGKEPHLELPTDVRATAFQRRVWEELKSIPYGSTRSYGEVARAIGQPNAARAVAQACATNSVALVVPCHRVVRENGDLGGYRWGTNRKARLLAGEKAAYNSEERVGDGHSEG
ncbi:MAG TPA: bifunctional DNA-binding transcriptional regulator/O6-methylguanine-DNA methyltransferase Ada [Chloroflexia bacterium]|nr:bifunctional DNA-binding transcriptional regulator/O6-methylguanine-DNA methyltransferase Ada [Chloroflexia bacterium]